MASHCHACVDRPSKKLPSFSFSFSSFSGLFSSVISMSSTTGFFPSNAMLTEIWKKKECS
jgi:hypothetical protein